jgi:hypothetical protein
MRLRIPFLFREVRHDGGPNWNEAEVSGLFYQMANMRKIRREVLRFGAINSLLDKITVFFYL